VSQHDEVQTIILYSRALMRSSNRRWCFIVVRKERSRFVSIRTVFVYNFVELAYCDELSGEQYL